MQNFDRQYRLTAGVPGQTGFEVGAPGADGRALRITFNLEKTTTQASNTGKITVYNLNDEHKAILKEEKCVVQLSAGYGSVLYPIFLGDVKNPVETITNADRGIEIEVFDGRTAFEVNISVAYEGVVLCQTVLTDIVTKMGIASTVYTESAKAAMVEKKYDNGYSFVGRGREALTGVCDMCGLKYTIQNGVLQIYVTGETVSSRGYVLSPSTGLISIPSKVKISKDGQEFSGYEVTYFINGAIGINDLVQLESKYVSGTYWVYKQTYDGDNYSGDWTCKAQLLEVKAK